MGSNTLRSPQVPHFAGEFRGAESFDSPVRPDTDQESTMPTFCSSNRARVVLPGVLAALGTAVAFADESPYPEESELFTHVYA